MILEYAGFEMTCMFQIIPAVVQVLQMSSLDWSRPQFREEFGSCSALVLGAPCITLPRLNPPEALWSWPRAGEMPSLHSLVLLGCCARQDCCHCCHCCRWRQVRWFCTSSPVCISCNSAEVFVWTRQKVMANNCFAGSVVMFCSSTASEIVLRTATYLLAQHTCY